VTKQLFDTTATADKTNAIRWGIAVYRAETNGRKPTAPGVAGRSPLGRSGPAALRWDSRAFGREHTGDAL